MDLAAEFELRALLDLAEELRVLDRDRRLVGEFLRSAISFSENVPVTGRIALTPLPSTASERIAATQFREPNPAAGVFGWNRVGGVRLFLPHRPHLPLSANVCREFIAAELKRLVAARSLVVDLHLSTDTHPCCWDLRPLFVVD